MVSAKEIEKKQKRKKEEEKKRKRKEETEKNRKRGFSLSLFIVHLFFSFL